MCLGVCITRGIASDANCDIVLGWTVQHGMAWPDPDTTPARHASTQLGVGTGTDNDNACLCVHMS